MAQGRDWLKTLNSASFKGVPFQTERDEEQGGRRVVSHEFPMRDLPFNEDLGAKKVDYDLTAYVASDNADSEADALVAVCKSRGAGILILPMQGPVLVKCVDYKRDREKDKAGKVAFALKFVAEGAATALISIASLAKMVFVQSNAMSASIANYLRTTIASVAQPDFVITAANDAVQDGAAILEAIRTTEAIDPTVSGAQRNAIKGLFAAAPDAVTADAGVNVPVVSQIVTIARALGDAMPANAAIAAFEQVSDQVVVVPKATYFTDAARQADANKATIYLAIRLAALTAYAEGIARVDIPDRQTAIGLRANATEYFEAAMNAMSADDADLYRAAVTLLNSVVDYLSRAILDRAPLISVGANRRMPSLWWTHLLYQDPTRSGELVARARVVHPSFMPTEFEALSR